MRVAQGIALLSGWCPPVSNRLTCGRIPPDRYGADRGGRRSPISDDDPQNLWVNALVAAKSPARTFRAAFRERPRIVVTTPNLVEQAERRGEPVTAASPSAQWPVKTSEIDRTGPGAPRVWRL